MQEELAAALKRAGAEDLRHEELDAVIEERNGLRQELKELTEQYVATTNLLHESHNAVPKGAATVMQVQKNKDIVSETTNMIETAKQNLTTQLRKEPEEEDSSGVAMSPSGVQEVERLCNFLRKTMRELSSPATNALLQVFGAPDALGQLVHDRDYESLLVLALKSMSTMLVNEHAGGGNKAGDVSGSGTVRVPAAVEESSSAQVQNGSPSRKGLNYDELRSAPEATTDIKGRSILRNSIEEYISAGAKVAPKMDKSHETTAIQPTIVNPPTEILRPEPQPQQREPSRGRTMSQRQDEFKLRRKEQFLNRGNPPQREGNQKFETWLRSYGSAATDPEGFKPLFNNYTKRTFGYFDPLLQFGGESVYDSQPWIKSALD